MDGESRQYECHVRRTVDAVVVVTAESIEDAHARVESGAWDDATDLDQVEFERIAEAMERRG